MWLYLSVMRPKDSDGIAKSGDPDEQYESGHAKMCLMPYANNKGADQPEHPRTLVVRYLDSMISILALSKVSQF